MFKKIKEQIEAIEWLSKWFKTNSRKRVLFIIVIALVVIAGGSKLFFLFFSQLAEQRSALNSSPKTISSTGQPSGITAESVTISKHLPTSTQKKSPEEEAHNNNVEHIKNKLRKIYGEISVLSDYPIPHGNLEALQEYEMRVNKWVSDACMWIERNIGFAAREIFLNRGEGGRIWSSDYDERLNQLMSDLKGYKLGLKELIKSEDFWHENKD